MWVFKDALPYLLGPATNTFCQLMLLDGDAQENEGFAASSDRWASSMQARCSTHGVYFMMMDNKVISYIYIVHIASPTFLFYPLSCLSYPNLSFAFSRLAFILGFNLDIGVLVLVLGS